MNIELDSKTDSNILNGRNVFILLVVLVLVDRCFQLVNFNFKFTGSDDTILWQGIIDYSRGIFHEPYFYGQNYNFMLESLFATPLYLIGVPIHIALPIVSCFLGIFPFLFIGFVFYKREKYLESYIFVAVLLLMPIEYGILTTVGRGFVNGMFFMAWMVYPLLEPKSNKSLFFFTLSLSLGYIFNPNTLIFSIPIGMYVFLNNIKNRNFYLIGIIILSLVLSIEYFAKSFYVNHPDYLVHQMWKLEFSFDLLFESLGGLDKLFMGLTPVFWIIPWLFMPLILLFGILIFKHDKLKAISLFTGLIFVFLSLGINKVHDNIDSLFLSSARMFLAAPLFLVLAIIWFLNQKGVEVSRAAMRSMVVTGFIVFFIKAGVYPNTIKAHTSKQELGPIAIKKVSDLKVKCEQFQNLVRKYNIDLILFSPDWQVSVPETEFYNYGCDAFYESVKPSLMTKYERRTWRFNEEKREVRKNILYYGNIYLHDFDTTALSCKIIRLEENIFVILNNDLVLEELTSKIKVNLSRN